MGRDEAILVIPDGRVTTPESEPRCIRVIVRLTGSDRPSYVTPLAWFGPTILTAEVDPATLERLRTDPSVASVEGGRPLPVIR